MLRTKTGMRIVRVPNSYHDKTKKDHWPRKRMSVICAYIVDIVRGELYFV